jgi:hypothetical protein
MAPDYSHDKVEQLEATLADALKEEVSNLKAALAIQHKRAQTPHPDRDFVRECNELLAAKDAKIDRLESQPSVTPCLWTYDEAHYKYDTECGNSFYFESDGIDENGFKFCPYCGKPLADAREGNPSVTQISDTEILVDTGGPKLKPQQEWPANPVELASPKCEICHDTDDVRKCPVMTQVTFSTPPEKQRYVCGPCIKAWYQGGGETAAEIRAKRGIKEPEQ